MYTNYFQRVEAVANFLLQNAARVRESCDGFDSRAFSACGDPHKFKILAQAVRAYDASTQVVESPNPPVSSTPHGPPQKGPAAFFASIDPKDHRRNPLDTIADRLPWDLFRNPWVVRNLFDLATTHYAYHDRLRFPDAAPGTDGDIPSSISFARDFGCGSAYAPGRNPLATCQSRCPLRIRCWRQLSRMVRWPFLDCYPPQQHLHAHQLCPARPGHPLGQNPPPLRPRTPQQPGKPRSP